MRRPGQTKYSLVVFGIGAALCLSSYCFSTPAFGQAASQETSGTERTRQLLEKEEALREKIETPKKPVEIEEQLPEITVPLAADAKIFIKEFRVTGTTLISKDETDKIILPKQNQEMLFSQVQKISAQITELYRTRGYITSRAYIPPQKVENGILEIKAIEAVAGDIVVKGNRYFSAALLKNKIAMKKGEPFNYNILRQGLAKINEQPDRYARVVLMPGKDPASTDMVMEVKDRLPIHVGFEFDNFGSRFIEEDRYTARISHNNLLGLDDKLSFQYQLAQASRYFLKSARYLLPVGDDMEFGLFTAHSRVKLGQNFEDTDARGKSHLYGLFLNKSLVNKDNLGLTANLGFDYKDITNYQAQAASSNDRMRVLKAGLDIDMTDNSGRTVITNELDFGIPNIMGGLREQDARASRAGAGGKFIKDTVNFLRLQKMPFSSSLLWKSQMQLSPYMLTASEQFQIGGIANVRGYPPAEAVGDKGYASTLEWSFPPYLISKNAAIPLSKAKLYDALRVTIFYDWANAHLKRPTATEEKNKTLRGVGYGFRLNLPEDFSIRLDFAWPLDNTPTDSDHMHPWIQVTKNF